MALTDAQRAGVIVHCIYAEHLENQCRVTFLATPRSALQRVRMTAGNPDIELVGAYGFFLKAADVQP
jgi:hypothetical protein